MSATYSVDILRPMPDRSGGISVTPQFRVLFENEGISQLELSRRTGINRGAINRLYNGEQNQLSAEKLQILANYFRVSLCYLLTGDEGAAENPSVSHQTLIRMKQALHELGVLAGTPEALEHSKTATPLIRAHLRLENVFRRLLEECGMTESDLEAYSSSETQKQA